VAISCRFFTQTPIPAQELLLFLVWISQVLESRAAAAKTCTLCLKKAAFAAVELLDAPLNAMGF
jgi:hypothetical protein